MEVFDVCTLWSSAKVEEDLEGYNVGKEVGIRLVLPLVVIDGIEGLKVEIGGDVLNKNYDESNILLDDGEATLETKGGFIVDIFNSFSKIEIKFLSSTNPNRQS